MHRHRFLLALFLLAAWAFVVPLVAFAQAPQTSEVVSVDWKMILATFVNGTLVLLIVSLINSARPVLREKYPWIIPIMATALGPVIGAGQTWVAAKLGYQIDFSPVIAALAGAAATTAHQVGKNLPARRPS